MGGEGVGHPDIRDKSFQADGRATAQAWTWGPVVGAQRTKDREEEEETSQRVTGELNTAHLAGHNKDSGFYSEWQGKPLEGVEQRRYMIWFTLKGALWQEGGSEETNSVLQAGDDGSSKWVGGSVAVVGSAGFWMYFQSKTFKTSL